jgi:inosose dehydratase
VAREGGVRLAGHTYAFRHLPLGEALDELSILGFTSVEVWLGHVAHPEEAAEALAARGLTAAAVSAGGFYEHGGADPLQAVALASSLHVRHLVACCAPARLAEVANLVPRGITLCVENHWDQVLAKPEELVRAISPHDGVAACLDTGHALLAGVEPARFASALGRRLRHVHLKEGRAATWLEQLLGRRLRRRLLPRPRPVSPGYGDLDLEHLACALLALGYEGTVTLEHEGADPAPALAQLLRRWREALEASSR